MASKSRIRTEQTSFLHLARKTDLDEETAYTICRLIDLVGWEIKGKKWDWDWLKEKRGGYRSLITHSLAASAWHLLAERDRLTLQMTNDGTRRITTVAPLEDMTNLRTLVLQDNNVVDLRPLSKMSRLRYLNIYMNKVSDVSPLAHLQSLEELSLSNNPVKSLSVLERLPNLRRLALSTDQVPYFAQCRRLPSVQLLEITGETPVDKVAYFPEMHSLKVLRIYQLRDTAGVEQFPSLTTLGLIYGQFSRLNEVEKLKELTHIEAWSSHRLSLEPLRRLFALRSVKIFAPEVTDLSALAGLPVLHEARMDDRTDNDKTRCNRSELDALCESLTPWADEFKAPEKKVSPSFEIEVVSQNTFDNYDSKVSFGIKPGECEDGMFKSEREWLVSELRSTLEVRFREDVDGDFLLPGTSGFNRTERLVLYSLRAYGSVREIVTAVQHVLCEARNDWIIYLQSLVSEGPDYEELPGDVEDFTAWIHPNKIMATEENASIVRELMN